MSFSVKRIIKDIRDDDELVQVVGVIKKVLGKTKITIEDKTGKIACEPIPDNSPVLKEGLIVKVYGAVSLDDNAERYIEPELIQDKTGLDLDLYYKTLEMLNKVLYE